MNKKYAPLLFGLVPLIVVLAFLAFKLYTVTTGTEILLKTAPVDPRDLFRGDYVNLRYEISSISMPKVPADRSFNPDETIYATLSREDKFWNIDAISHDKPELKEESVCMKGKVMYASSDRLTVEWGIESYFVPEGEGRIIERQRNLDLSVLVSVDSSCSSVIKSLLINDTEVKFR